MCSVTLLVINILQPNSGNPIYCDFTCEEEEFNLDDALRQFWEIEQVNAIQKFNSAEEQAYCNNHFLGIHR